MLAFDRLIERQAIAASLRAAGIPFSEANDISTDEETAAAVASAPAFDVLLVDGHGDAAEAGRALETVRRLTPSTDVRGILLIDPSAKPNLKKFRTAGFASYLVRPVRPQALLAQLGLLPEAEQPAGTSTSNQHDVPASAGAPSGQPSHCRVLLAEDNAVNALLARVMLQKSGCDVTHVTDGEQALEAVKASISGEKPAIDLVLMDIHMPRMDGLQAAAAIRALALPSPGSGSGATAPRLPVMVALTANAFAEDRERCLAAGLDDYLAKPFQKSELAALLTRWRIVPAAAPNRAPSEAAA
jgi:CheY-like chemotaxis protein